MALSTLGVSTPEIDSIVAKLTESFPQRIGVKITGGGFGGCLLVVHDASIEEAHVVSLLPSDMRVHWNVQFRE